MSLLIASENIVFKDELEGNEIYNVHRPVVPVP